MDVADVESVDGGVEGSRVKRAANKRRKATTAL